MSCHKCMSCHKAIVVITGRAHCFHDNIYIYYAHLASVRFEHSVCSGSLMATYIHINNIKLRTCRVISDYRAIYYVLRNISSRCLEVFSKKDVLKNFAKFTGK